MREKAMWAVLHKSWEESMKSDRTLLRQLMLKTTGEQLWSASEPELIQRFPEKPDGPRKSRILSEPASYSYITVSFVILSRNSAGNSSAAGHPLLERKFFTG